MRVKCLYNRGSELDTNYLLRCRDTVNTEYPLKKGEIYVVYGQAIIEDLLYYLVLGTYQNLPNWYPAELFEIVDGSVCFDWFFRYDIKQFPTALWGYYELIVDKDHYENLIEREPVAVKTFLKRKKEIDELS